MPYSGQFDFKPVAIDTDNLPDTTSTTFTRAQLDSIFALAGFNQGTILSMPEEQYDNLVAFLDQKGISADQLQGLLESAVSADARLENAPGLALVLGWSMTELANNPDSQQKILYPAQVSSDWMICNQAGQAMGPISAQDELGALQTLTGGYLIVEVTDNPFLLKTFGTEGEYYLPAVEVTELPEGATVFSTGMTFEEFSAAITEDSEGAHLSTAGGTINLTPADYAEEGMRQNGMIILGAVTLDNGAEFVAVVGLQNSDVVYLVPARDNSTIPGVITAETTLEYSNEPSVEVVNLITESEEIPLEYMDEPYRQGPGRNSGNAILPLDGSFGNLTGGLTTGKEIGSLQISIDPAALPIAQEGIQALIDSGEGPTEYYQLALDIITNGTGSLPDNTAWREEALSALFFTFLDLNDYTRQNGGTVFFELEGLSSLSDPNATAADFTCQVFAYEKLPEGYLAYSPDGYAPGVKATVVGVESAGVTLAEGVEIHVAQVTLGPAEPITGLRNVYGYVPELNGWVAIAQTDASPLSVEAMLFNQYGVDIYNNNEGALGFVSSLITGPGRFVIGSLMVDGGMGLDLLGVDSGRMTAFIGAEEMRSTWVGALLGIEPEDTRSIAGFQINPNDFFVYNRLNYNITNAVNYTILGTDGDLAVTIGGTVIKGSLIFADMYAFNMAFGFAGKAISGGSTAPTSLNAALASGSGRQLAGYMVANGAPKLMMLQFYGQIAEGAGEFISGDLSQAEQALFLSDVFSLVGASNLMVAYTRVSAGDSGSEVLQRVGNNSVREFVFIGSAVLTEELIGSPEAGALIAMLAYPHFGQATRSTGTDIVAEGPRFEVESAQRNIEYGGRTVQGYAIEFRNPTDGTVIARGISLVDPASGENILTQVKIGAAYEGTTLGNDAAILAIFELNNMSGGRPINVENAMVVPTEMGFDPLSIIPADTSASAVEVRALNTPLLGAQIMPAETTVEARGNTTEAIAIPAGWIRSPNETVTAEGLIPIQDAQNSTIRGFYNPNDGSVGVWSGGMLAPSPQFDTAAIGITNEGRFRPAEVQALQDAAALVNQYVEQGVAPDQSTIESVYRILAEASPNPMVHDLVTVFNQYYRLGDAGAGVAHPEWLAPVNEVRPRMEGIYASLEEGIERLDADPNRTREEVFQLAANFYSRYIYTHPFHDYNDRTGYLVVNWILMRYGYEPFTINETNIGQYVNTIQNINSPADYMEFLNWQYGSGQ
ncbi:MAG: Fic family protein [Candidatus Omnitrophica bacterium]|nr:Fic family protein [Candidatus Omnitrophota bacterium]